MNKTIGRPSRGGGVLAARDQNQAVNTNVFAQALAAMRIAFGLTFLWAFLDKLFGLGFSTPSEGAVINGGSPTDGYLSNVPDGPFEDLYHSLAGVWLVDVLFMLGLLVVGITLTLGIAIRIGALVGVLLYVMMWTVVLPPENHPILDEHILGALGVAVVGLGLAGDTWGLGRWWGAQKAVRKNPVLR
ncbi:DoxX family membrane protein [Mumia sp. zg.B21]|uniref:DoxX family membrane protein n=1 Tax=Mumia sp. zg.B21 TaxID=2855447 RepID=UPI0021028FCF|nr:DoxX family membrane protein [Mumia sp. zg.B21]